MFNFGVTFIIENSKKNYMKFIKRKIYQLRIKLLKLIGGDDEAITVIQYFLRNNCKPDLKNPKELSEKQLWLKLNYYKEDYGKFVDKYEVRNYVEEKIGKKYLNEIFNVYNKASQIDFDTLPNQFVLKATHGSGYNIIVENVKELDIKQTKKKLNQFLSQNYYHKFQEAIYKNVTPRIIAEKYISKTDKDLVVEYKFFCYHGEPKYIYAEKKESGNIQNSFYDLDWNKILPQKNNPTFLKSSFIKPANLYEMIEVAKKLSEEFIFLRVDLYAIGSKIIFGELTFFTGAGLVKSSIERFNKEFGDLIVLPN